MGGARRYGAVHTTSGAGDGDTGRAGGRPAGQWELPAALPPGQPNQQATAQHNPGGKVQGQLPAPPPQPFFSYKFTNWKLLTSKFIYRDAKVP